MAGGTNASPEIMEHISLPCLRILQQAMVPSASPNIPKVHPKPMAGQGPKPASGLPPRKPRGEKVGGETSKEVKHGTTSQKSSSVFSVTRGAYSKGVRVGVDLQKWLIGDPVHSYDAWKKRNQVAKLEKKPPNFSKMTKVSL